MKIIRLVSVIIMGFFGVILFSACGGGEGSETSDALSSEFVDTTTTGATIGESGQVSDTTTMSSTGAITLLMTDGPSLDFDQIILTVTGVKLLGVEDEETTLFEGEMEFDLLALRNFSEVFLMNDEVPVGTFSKIRLLVSSVQLITLGEEGEDDNVIDADVPANGKIDLNPRGDFTIAEGSHTLVTIDIDAEKSILAHEAVAGKYLFRPVVFIDVEAEEVEQARLVKFEGIIAEIDEENELFLLCGDLGNTEVCYDIAMDEETSMFDSEPVLIEFADLMVEDHVVLHGWMQDDEGDESELNLLAAVVEVGDIGVFSFLSGMSTTAYDVDLNAFNMDVDGTDITVQLQGTRVFNQHGDELEAGEITEDSELNVSGIQEDDVMKATVVFVHILSEE
ncbi:MAG: DUF4382 domain-containing protein [Pseudomonadales bacterium]|nr:DUF4382 domain-containing protein [Pseudomonadales bacterium]